jgi:hypothetical protein
LPSPLPSALELPFLARKQKGRRGFHASTALSRSLCRGLPGTTHHPGARLSDLRTTSTIAHLIGGAQRSSSSQLRAHGTRPTASCQEGFFAGSPRCLTRAKSAVRRNCGPPDEGSEASSSSRRTPFVAAVPATPLRMVLCHKAAAQRDLVSLCLLYHVLVRQPIDNRDDAVAPALGTRRRCVARHSLPPSIRSMSGAARRASCEPEADASDCSLAGAGR